MRAIWMIRRGSNWSCGLPPLGGALSRTDGRAEHRPDEPVGFCRNCLSKWYRAAAEDKGLELSYDDAREIVYGMPYDEWKGKHQAEASADQMAAYEASKKQLECVARSGHRFREKRHA